MKAFKAEKNDVFTAHFDKGYLWVWRGKTCASLQDYVKGIDDFDNTRARNKNEITLTPAQVNAWAAANDIKIEWPDEQTTFVEVAMKPDPILPLSFREQAAIAAMAAMISCCRVNNLGVQLKDDFDSSYFNRETGMDHDTLRNEYDGCKEIAADAWVFADHLEAERIRRINGKDAT